VRWWPFRSVAGSVVQVPTVVGPLTRVSAGQVIVTQELPEPAVCGVHELTSTLVVTTGRHVVSRYALPEVGPAVVQVCTATLVVVAVRHEVVVYELVEVGVESSVHDALPTSVVVRIGQSVAV
jgi:hypothetical protein